MFRKDRSQPSGDIHVFEIGALTRDEFHALRGEIELLTADGKRVKLLLELEAPLPRTSEMLGDDMAHELIDASPIERVAVVGGSEAERDAIELCEGLFPGEYRLFGRRERDRALAWLTGT